jgi:SWI/SNF-related matrix-associated actin-dependent regulator 1 of chromatin subfamily A
VPRAAKPGAPAPHGFDDHPSPDADADPDPDGAVAVDEQLAGVWRQQNPETGLFPAAVIEGVRELAAADDALAAEVAAVAAKARSAAQKAKDKAANAAVKREAKAAKAAARAAAMAERRAEKKQRHEPTPELSEGDEEEEENEEEVEDEYVPINSGKLVTVCGYPDRGAPSFQANPFVARVRGYNASDDTYCVKGAFEREKSRKVAAWRVQERVLFSDSFDQTIASCAPPTRAQVKRMANEEGRRLSQGPIDKAHAETQKAKVGAAEARKQKGKEKKRRVAAEAVAAANKPGHNEAERLRRQGAAKDLAMEVALAGASESAQRSSASRAGSSRCSPCLFRGSNAPRRLCLHASSPRPWRRRSWRRSC